MSSAETAAAPAPAGIDPAMLATLTPEEQEAFKADTDDVAALKALADGAADDADADGDDDDDSDDADDAGEDATAAAPAAAAPAAAPASVPAAPAAAPATAAADDDNSDEFAPPPAPVFSAPMPEKYDERMAGFAADRTKVAKQFADGEIDEAKRDAEFARIEGARDELLIAKGQALTAQNHTTQAAAQTWQATVSNFIAHTAKVDGIDYRNDAARAKHLDNFVKVLAADEANEGKSMSWFLKQAHKSVNALMGTPAKSAAPAAPAAPAAAPTPKQEAVAKRKPNPAAAATTVAHVPGGEGADAVAGEFADIDALDGEDFEAAIAKMSPTQREKFTRGQ